MKRILLILFTIFFLIPNVNADYYENITDECETLDNIQVIQNLIINGTFIGFNNSASGSGFDFEYHDDYTLAGAHTAKITKINNTGTQIDSDLDDEAYLYYDWGTDGIDDFVVTFAVDTITQINNGRNYGFSVGNELGDANVWENSIGYRGRYSTGDAKYQYQLMVEESDVKTTYTYLVPSGSPWIWVTLVKDDTEVYMEIYSDSSRTSLLANHTHTLASDVKYRYSYLGATDDVSLNGRRYQQRIYNVKGLTSQGITDGVIYTKDLMNGISTPSTVVKSYGEIAGINDITMEYSNDNLTWINDYDIRDGWNARHIKETTLYLRFNFSRPSSEGKCNLENFTVLYESSCEGSGGGYRWNETTPSVNISKVALILGNRTGFDAIDGNYVNVTEIAGTPAFDARFNVSVPDDSVNINLAMYGEYEGNPAHNVTFEYYDHIKSTWIIVGQMESGTGLKWFNISLSNFPFNEIVSPDGYIWGRLYHYSAGNINHKVLIDYMKVIYFEPTSTTGSVSGGLSPMLLIIFILVIIIVLVMYKMGVFRK